MGLVHEIWRKMSLFILPVYIFAVKISADYQNHLSNSYTEIERTYSPRFLSLMKLFFLFFLQTFIPESRWRRGSSHDDGHLRQIHDGRWAGTGHNLPVLCDHQERRPRKCPRVQDCHHRYVYWDCEIMYRRSNDWIFIEDSKSLGPTVHSVILNYLSMSLLYAFQLSCS